MLNPLAKLGGLEKKLGFEDYILKVGGGGGVGGGVAEFSGGLKKSMF